MDILSFHDIDLIKNLSIPGFLFKTPFKEQLSSDAKILYGVLLELAQSQYFQPNLDILVVNPKSLCIRLGLTCQVIEYSFSMLKEVSLIQFDKNLFSDELKIKFLKPSALNFLTLTDVSQDTYNHKDENQLIDIKENIQYDYLLERYPNNSYLKDILKIMNEVITSTKVSQRIGGEEKPMSVVKSVFVKLNQYHIEYVLESLSKTTTQAVNIRAYLITTLFNSYSTMDAFYTNKVQHDLSK